MKYAALPLILAAATVLAGEEPYAASAGTGGTAFELRTESFYDVWIRERLTLGVSLSHSRLTDADRPEDWSRRKTFVGYVNHLSNESEYSFAPELTWLASDFVRVGLSWRETEVRTRNFREDPNLHRRLSDGNATESGFVLSVEGTYPFMDGKLRPHAGVGIGFYKGDFEEDTWWRLGYASPVSWEAAGKPRRGTAAGHYREIRVDDETAFLASIGVSWRPAPHWELDFTIRKTWLDPDCEFGYVDSKTHKWSRELSGDFDMDTLAAAFTVSWVF